MTRKQRIEYRMTLIHWFHAYLTDDKDVYDKHERELQRQENE